MLCASNCLAADVTCTLYSIINRCESGIIYVWRLNQSVINALLNSLNLELFYSAHQIKMVLSASTTCAWSVSHKLKKTFRFMKITILAIGKKHDAKLEGAILDYTKRLNYYASCEWLLVEAKITSSMNSEQIVASESDVLRSKIKQTDVVILLDERGSELTSPTLAERIQKFKNGSVQNLTFIIGGAYGVDEQLQERADFIWSLSKLVFPHQLVRLVLIEQLYRAHTILAGEKYHHS